MVRVDDPFANFLGPSNKYLVVLAIAYGLYPHIRHSGEPIAPAVVVNGLRNCGNSKCYGIDRMCSCRRFEGQTWYIDAESVDCVRQYEQHCITVRGVIRVKQQLLANGTRLPDRVMLTEVLVLE